MIALSDFLPYLNIVLVVCLTIGGLFAFRNGRQTQLNKFQKDTIDALQQRIEVLESKITDLEKENSVQHHVIDTITSALKKRGLVISVDGELFPIAEKPTHRKRTITTQQSATITKKEED